MRQWDGMQVVMIGAARQGIALALSCKKRRQGDPERPAFC